MSRTELIAVPLFFAGCASLVAAAENFADAQSCTPIEVSPAVCEPAHSRGPEETSSGSYCGWNGSYLCFNLEDCSSQYGTAHSGVCDYISIGGSGGTSLCVEDDHVTVVPINYYDAFCVFGSYGCTCYWTVSNQQPQQYASLCDCTD